MQQYYCEKKHILRNKISEVEEQLKEEHKIHQKLRNEAETKLKQIAQVNENIAKEEADFSEMKTRVLDGIRQFGIMSAARLKHVEMKCDELSQNIAAFDIIYAENKSLDSRLKNLSEQWYIASKEQESVREAKKQKNFETRMKMDQILRKTIKDFDQDYQSEAILTMDRDAEAARKENVNLLKELADNAVKCQKLIQKQQKSYEELLKVSLP